MQFYTPKQIEITFKLYQLDIFLEYNDYIENRIQSELDRMEKEASNIPKEIQDEYWDFHYDELSFYRDSVGETMRSSLFLSIHSFFELKLRELALELNDNDKNQFKNNKNGLGNIKYNIKGVKGFEFPDQSKEWQKILLLSTIRNCFVHGNGYIDSQYGIKNHVEEKIEEFKNIEVDKNKKIILKKSFCQDYIELIKVFLKKLYLEKTRIQSV